MPDAIGRIEVPEIVSSGVFPLTPDYPHGRRLERRVAVHRFGSANAKIEQRFLLGNGAPRYLFRRNGSLCPADVKALVDFWEARKGPYQPFTYNAPADAHGGATSAITVRFANAPLTVEELETGSRTGLEFVQEVTAAPSYTVGATVTRFPSSTLETALTAQAQEVIPLVRIRVKEAAVDDIFLSDRRCTVGGQLYQRRLLGIPEGITQTIDGGSDTAVFEWGNADRVMRDLAHDTSLLYATVEFSLYHVASEIKLDFWAGRIVDFSGEASPVFTTRCSDPLSDVSLTFPPRTVSRLCSNLFDDGNGCPFTAQGALDTGGFPSASADECDQGFNSPNGCQAHGMEDYYRGIFAQPQRVNFRASSGGLVAGIGRPRVTASSVVNETHYGDPIPLIYTDVSIPVRAMIMTARDEDEFYAATGVVGEGPILLAASGHRLDGQTNHGPGALGLRVSAGPTPNTAFFGLTSTGDADGPERAAGTAFLELRRTDAKGFQVGQDAQHELMAVVTRGLQGFTWSGPGSRSSSVTLTNPAWVVIDALLRAMRREHLSAAAQEALFDVAAAVAFATICSTTVDRVVGSGTTAQFKYRGIVTDRKPLRDWIQEILNNALGYYTFSFGKLRLGSRVDSVAVEAYTDGNVLLDSFEPIRRAPAFNQMTAEIAERVVADDGSVQLQGNHVRVRDQDAAQEEGLAGSPAFREGRMNLAGTIDRDQAARIAATRLREEVGGVTAAERRDIRDARWKTTLLGLASECGQVVSFTSDELPGGAGEFRISKLRLNADMSIDVDARGVRDSMYDLTVGSLDADVEPDGLPDETAPELLPAHVTNFNAQEDPEVDPATGQTMSRVTVSYDEPTDSPSFRGVVIWAQHYDGTDTGTPGTAEGEPIEITRIGVNAAPAARRLPLFQVTQKVLRVGATPYSDVRTVPLDWAAAPNDYVLLDGKQSAPTQPANPWCQWIPGGLDISADKNPEDDLEAYLIAFTGDKLPYDLGEGTTAIKPGHVIGEIPARNVTGERWHFPWQEPIYEGQSDGTNLDLHSGAKEWTANEWLVETAEGVFEGCNCQLLDEAGSVVANHAIVSNTAERLVFAAASIPTGRLRFRFRGANGELLFFVAARDRSKNVSEWAAVPECEVLARDGTTDRDRPLVFSPAPGTFHTFFTAGFTGLTEITTVDAAKSLQGVVGVQVKVRSETEAETDPDVAKMYSIRGVHTVEIELTYSTNGVDDLVAKTWRFPWKGEGKVHLDNIHLEGWTEKSRYVIDLPGVMVASARARVANAWGFGPWATCYPEFVRGGGGPVATGSAGQRAALIAQASSGTISALRIDRGRRHVFGPLTGTLTINLPNPAPEAGEEVEYEIIQPTGSEGYAVTLASGYKDVGPVSRVQATKTVLRFRAESASVMRCVGQQTLPYES